MIVAIGPEQQPNRQQPGMRREQVVDGRAARASD